MPFQMTDPELRRWLLVLHQIKAMRGTMRMRPQANGEQRPISRLSR